MTNFAEIDRLIKEAAIIAHEINEPEAKTSEEIMKEIDRLSDIQKNWNMAYNEGHEGYLPHEEEISALFDEYLKVKKVEENAEWTLEVLEARRAKWNSRVREILGDKMGQKMTALEYNTLQINLEKELGYGLGAIQRHKARLGVK